ncbi:MULTISPECIES: LytTR family DNA-binding domain-containing protein [unclassified Spirosoma]|uniref:LytR/AlgR family response regulator transcription factor n=1 Tax=unclassified Spirosoma TaxID=2621999 RepID=UPI00095F6F92|nr:MULTISPECIES: response regulator transcription factor [unclassified Spirosoma]MBN8824993.1 response regulator transcription factor [Spirosoma sp.]OJW73288.1 MAG: DNA-binding response regulator [Spirosoma sp. 48-14]
MANCLVVDDEAPARALLMGHLSTLPGFTVLACLDNAVDAFTFLQTNPVDLAFLDIQMPRLSGLDLIRSLKTRPRIILTTAYREHAVTAFELDVLDYLVKPITQERFMRAVSKYLHSQNNSELPSPIASRYDEMYMFFKVGRDQVKIFLRDIVFIEGLGDYIKVHTNEKTYVASEKLGYMEHKLPADKFIRVHKSFIIAWDKLLRYNPDQVTVVTTTLPLGRLYKGAFFRKLQTGNVCLSEVKVG